MTPRSKPHGLIDQFTDVFGQWLEHRREIQELRQLDQNAFAGIARELGVTPTDLDRFVRQGPHAVDELSRLLEALGIDEGALSRAQPLVLRDMVRVCAACQQKRRCDFDLESGSSAQHYGEYCLNAPTIQALDQKTR
jgi:transcriptional regulator with XRE-family HTH domain